MDYIKNKYNQEIRIGDRVVVTTMSYKCADQYLATIEKFHESGRTTVLLDVPSTYQVFSGSETRVDNSKKIHEINEIVDRRMDEWTTNNPDNIRFKMSTRAKFRREEIEKFDAGCNWLTEIKQRRTVLVNNEIIKI